MNDIKAEREAHRPTHRHGYMETRDLGARGFEYFSPDERTVLRRALLLYAHDQRQRYAIFGTGSEDGSLAEDLRKECEGDMPEWKK